MAMLTMRAIRFLQRKGRNLRANGTTSIRQKKNQPTMPSWHSPPQVLPVLIMRGHEEIKEPMELLLLVLICQRWNAITATGEGILQRVHCDGIGSHDWSFQTEEEPTNYALMAFTSSSSSNSDNEVASCSKACTKAYATHQSYYDRLTNDLRKSQFDFISYKTGLESVEARILVYQQNETVFEEDIKLLKLDVQLRDNALVELRKKFEKAKQERDELKLKLDKFQTSSKNLSQLLASQTSDKTGLGYDNQVFNSYVFDCDEMFSFESDLSMPTSPIYDRYKSGEGYHVVPPPYTGSFMPPKLDLVFHGALTINEKVSIAFNVEPNPTKPDMDLSQSNLPSALSWVSDLEDESEVEHPILAEHLRKDIPKSRGHRHSRNSKACFVCKSLTYLIKDCDYYENKMVQKPVKKHAMRGNHQHYARMTHSNPQRHVVPTSVLTRSSLVPLTAARPVTTAVPQTKVQHQSPTKHGVTKAHSPKRRPINLRSSPTHSNFHQKVTTVQTIQVNVIKGVKENWIQVSYGLGPQKRQTFLFHVHGYPQHALKDKGVIDTMSDSEDSNITYTVVSSPFGGLSDIESSGVDGPPMMPEDPYAYVPVYLEFMPAEDDILLAEEQPLPAAASPTTESSGYIDESDPDEDPEEDPEEDPADYPADRGDEGDDEDESSDDDEDDDIDIEGDG
nr:hypothetical protein [Tanacetum cinerariifolium]